MYLKLADCAQLDIRKYSMNRSLAEKLMCLTLLFMESLINPPFVWHIWQQKYALG